MRPSLRQRCRVHPSGLRQRLVRPANLVRAARWIGSEQIPHRPEEGLVSWRIFGFFRRTHPASIHPFGEAEDRLFTATFALECRPMDLPCHHFFKSFRSFFKGEHFNHRGYFCKNAEINGFFNAAAYISPDRTLPSQHQ